VSTFAHDRELTVDAFVEELEKVVLALEMEYTRLAEAAVARPRRE